MKEKDSKKEPEEKDLSDKMDKDLKRLLDAAEKLDSETRWYYSRCEKWHYQKIKPVVRAFAEENNARIKMVETKDEGYFILQAPEFCLTEIGRIDKKILRFMQRRHVFIRPKKDRIQVEIMCLFRRRARKYPLL